MTQSKNSNHDIIGQDIISDEVMATLLEAAPSMAPPHTLRAKVLARVRGPASMTELITLRGDEGKWIQMRAGIEIKLLFQDQKHTKI